jgi:hypothetical protein
LAGRIDQQLVFAPGHEHDVTHGLDPRVLPDRSRIALNIRGRSLAGRVDQIAAIDLVEVFWDGLVQVAENGQGALEITGGSIRRRPG